MNNKLYIVRYYGLNTEGDELFSKGCYCTIPEIAKRELQSYTNDFEQTLKSYLYPSRVSLYVHLIIRELENGEYKYKKSAIYSCCEKCETTTYKENPVFAEL